MNEEFSGGSSSSWWEGKEFLNYVACGMCGGTEEIGKPVPDEPESGDICGWDRLDNPSPGKIRTTSTYVKLRRRKFGNKEMDGTRRTKTGYFSARTCSRRTVRTTVFQWS